MDSRDYIIAWLVYLLASGIVAYMCWDVLRKLAWRQLALILECLLVALLFTPWYVLPEAEFLAPAFIVFMLDTITIDSATAIRALIPLVMSLLLAIIVALVTGFVLRVRRRRLAKKVSDSSAL